MTDTSTTGPRLAGNPATGELVNLDDVTLVDLVALVETSRELARELSYHVDELVDEAARRLDRTNSRTANLEDGTKVETNAPTVDEYTVPAVRDALERLIEAEVLDAAVLRTVIVRPAPSTPPPRVDKRELNKLKAHDDPRVARLLGGARERKPQRRTLKIDRPEGNR
jgi:hypothetical protein